MSGLGPGTLASIKQGTAVLFLGAGASLGAVANDRKIPLGDDLRNLIANHFLSGQGKDWTLSKVAELAADQSDWISVQKYVAKNLEVFGPSDFHRKIPNFRWKAIFTTNYDLIVEKAYRENEDRIQRLAPVIRDNENYLESLTDPTCVPYVKLHGCVSYVSDPSSRLVLCNEDYARFSEYRSNLVAHFRQIARESTVIFVGYNLADPHIQQILFDVSDPNVSKPRYVLVQPELKRIEIDYWSARRVDVFQGTFEAFLFHISSQVSTSEITLSALVSDGANPLTKKIASHTKPSADLLWYLSHGVEYVSPASSVGASDASAFTADFQGTGTSCQRDLIYRGLSEIGFLKIFSSIPVK